VIYVFIQFIFILCSFTTRKSVQTLLLWMWGQMFAMRNSGPLMSVSRYVRSEASPGPSVQAKATTRHRLRRRSARGRLQT